VSRPALLGDSEREMWLARHVAWRVEGGHLVRDLRTTTYGAAVAIISSTVPLAKSLDHHPIITLGYRDVKFELWTHDRNGITELDLRYAEGLDNILVAFTPQIESSS